jgi:hypothetical protein
VGVEFGVYLGGKGLDSVDVAAVGGQQRHVLEAVGVEAAAVDLKIALKISRLSDTVPGNVTWDRRRSA